MRRFGENSKGVARHITIMAGAFYGGCNSAVLFHIADCSLQIAFSNLTVLQRPNPELAFFGAAAAIAKHHRQGKLAFTEIITNRLAKNRLNPRIIKRIIDQLEGQAQILSIAAQSRLFFGGSIRNHSADLGCG